jgi:hypothetical protein
MPGCRRRCTVGRHLAGQRLVSHVKFRATAGFGVEKFAAALIQRAPGQTVRVAS